MSAFLSNELCGCPTACSNMQILTQYRPYEFNYNQAILTNDKEYEWIGYLNFPGDQVFISGNNLPIQCSFSDFYNSNAFHYFTQLDDYTCLYNSTFNNAFISLRKLSASQQFTIYFEQSRRRELCGWCACNDTCILTTSIVFAVITFILVCVFIIFMWKHKNMIKRLFSRGSIKRS
jgi:hypothetical protein